MSLGLLMLHIALGTLLPGAPSETSKQGVSSQNDESALIAELAESGADLSKKLALVQGMIQDLEKQNLELKEIQEKNAEITKLEISAINERLFAEREKHLQEIKNLEQTHAETVKLEIQEINERLLQEKAQHLNQITILEKELVSMNDKVDWLDKKAIKRFSTEIGGLIETATLPDTPSEAPNATRTTSPASLSIFRYRPEIKKSGGYLGVEFLWWKVYEGALDYAIKGQIAPNQGSDEIIGPIGKLESASFSWAPGYRTYIGYRFRPDFWELEASYTYYHSSRHNKARHPKCCPPNVTVVDSVATGPEKAVVGTFAQFTDTPMALGKSLISLNYNLGDLLLARRFLTSDAIIMRVLLGGTGAWIDQHWHYKYLPGDFIIDGFDAGSGATVRGKENWKFSGGGVRLGLDMDWFAGKGFSILSEGSFALFFGSYSKLSYNEVNNHFPPGLPPPPEPQFPQVINNLRQHDDRFVFHTRLSFLPAWGMHFNKWGFLLYAGYELNFFANLQEVLRPLSFSDRSFDGRETGFTYGFLGIQGLTAGLKLDF
jgi:hypothetical protein